MNDIETELDESTSEKKPRRTRKRSEEGRIFVYRTVDGKPVELGAFPETAIAPVGKPLERCAAVFVKEIYGAGDYRFEKRKPNGHFERAFDVSIAAEPERADSARQNIIEFEPEEDFEEPENFAFVENDGQPNALHFQLLIEKEKTKRLETELQAIRIGNQNEKQTADSALEKLLDRNEALMMMLLTNAQKPQQDATTQAMNLLEKSFGMVTKARAISDELAPPETNSNGYLGEAANLINALGKNAGTFLPLFMNRSAPTAKPPTAPKNSASKPTNGNQSGELSDLLAKVKNKKAGETK